MSTLAIAGDDLRATAGSLRAVIADLHTAGRQAHAAADVVGHARLASKVRSFADAWDVHRGRTVELLSGFADGMIACAEVFDDLDSSLAAHVGGGTVAAGSDS